ncbi:MAG: aspartate carbamoyltransferase catalytic subunit [Streptococcaceae bacterium]|uniref:Aspartate carbamoyltransferase n=1 Tax=Lactococcus protaetiae TaxID=2592653 RepID=A0A514ZAJ3_9LACT|nr:aspartate carbamoyltransferase catalytic subunit [Streptococcaceae bacterium]QDK71591.1 aspartate carbamoyltransferase catalytic subunit [Lactococcus protaetiae]
MSVKNGLVSLSNLTTMENLSTEEVMALIKRAQAHKSGTAEFNLPKQTFASNLFFENSTRTHHSFHIAERKLGLDVLEFDAQASSISKGETLYDTVLTLCALGVEVCVIRSGVEHYYEELVNSENITCAIVNGGDGSGQHPSQCLLDLMTIYEEFGRFEGLKIAISGDLTHSRVAKSNMMMLKKLGAKLYFTGPAAWYSEEFDAYGHYANLDRILPELDVHMLLRVQHERHASGEVFSKESYHRQFGLTEERARLLKPTAIIMHPAPVNRDVEISDNLVESPQSRIVQQMSNGVYTRMAILEAIMQKQNEIKQEKNLKVVGASISGAISSNLETIV